MYVCMYSYVFAEIVVDTSCENHFGIVLKQRLLVSVLCTLCIYACTLGHSVHAVCPGVHAVKAESDQQGGRGAPIF